MVVTVVTEIPRAVNVFINELKDYAVRESNTQEEVINTQQQQVVRKMVKNVQLASKSDFRGDKGWGDAGGWKEHIACMRHGPELGPTEAE